MIKLARESDRTRQRLHALISADPGIHVARIALLAGMSWNTCQYHLRTMEAEGQVLKKKVNGRVCWFDRTRGVLPDKTATCLLRNREYDRIARHILSHPGQSQLDSARGLQMTPSTLHRRVVRLEQAGLVMRRPDHREVRVYPSETLWGMVGPAG